jgi:tol-pal system protein YbgF
LEKRIAELERSYGQAMVRVERLSDRVELLDDKVETQRLAMDRRGGGFGAPLAPLEPLEPLPSRGTLTTDAGLFQGRKVQLPEMQVTVAELPDPPARQLPVEVLAPKADEVGAEEKIVITESDYQKFLELRGEPVSSDGGGGGGGGRAPRMSGGGGVSGGAPSGGRQPQEDVVKDERLAVGGQASSDAGPALAPAPAAGGGEESWSSPTEMYKGGLTKYRAGQYQDALALFDRYLKSSPDPDYIDNVYYWIGECKYGLAQYQESISYFDKVIQETPGGNKVPDSMLKASYAYEKLGQVPKARKILEAIIQTYPNTNAADLAAKKLKDLRAGGEP